MLRHMCHVSPMMPKLPFNDSVTDRVASRLDLMVHQEVRPALAVCGLHQHGALQQPAPLVCASAQEVGPSQHQLGIS